MDKLLIDFLIPIISNNKEAFSIFIFGFCAMKIFERTALVAMYKYRDAISLENYIFTKQLKECYPYMIALLCSLKLLITGF